MGDTVNPNDYPKGFAIETRRTEEQIRAVKSFGARCGHIKRRLSKDEPLKGKLLELALDLAGDDVDNGNDLNIARKLIAGEKLSEYEYHVFVEVILLHARLSD